MIWQVCVYRWLGCRGCISSCITVPLDQVVDIWNRYQTALRRQTLTTPDNNTEKCKNEGCSYTDLFHILHNYYLWNNIFPSRGN